MIRSCFFGYVVTAGDVPILVFQRKDIDRYVVLQTSVWIGAEHKTILGKLSKEEVARLTNEVVEEFAKARIGYAVTPGPDLALTEFNIIRRVPITANLTETVFMDQVDGIQQDSQIAREVIAFAIERHSEYKSK